MVFKGCARCKGDMYREEDIGQTDLVCLQCGHRFPADRTSIEVLRGRAHPARPKSGRSRLKIAA
jgi:DNA-directed RNA polymerase subunit M/transcription elongation factor TFIIS